MRIFVSHLTKDRNTAGEIRAWLAELGLTAFLAHEDIAVSEEWRTAILEGLRQTQVFIAILDAAYFQSAWCSQEFGIAAFLGIQIIPLSLDGTIPAGFGSHIQSRFAPNLTEMKPHILSALARVDRGLVVQHLINSTTNSGSFDQANRRFPVLEPFLANASDQEIILFLSKAAANSQIAFANTARSTITRLLNSHGQNLPEDAREYLRHAVG